MLLNITTDLADADKLRVLNVDNFLPLNPPEAQAVSDSDGLRQQTVGW